jgi:hypothetical protein
VEDGLKSSSTGPVGGRKRGCGEEWEARQAAIGITVCITIWVENHASGFNAITM